jgi:hypothetical protein
VPTFIYLSVDILLLNEPIRSTPAQRQKSADSVEKVGFFHSPELTHYQHRRTYWD